MEVDIPAYLNHMKDQLLKEDNWQKFQIDVKWRKTIPKVAGVYILREGDKIVYVGETGNLRGRMKDLTDSRNHTVRRTIGMNLFSTTDGFIKASSSVKFPDHIELLVSDHLCNNLMVAVLPVALGRKELEELIEDSIDTGIRLNKRGKRK